MLVDLLIRHRSVLIDQHRRQNATPHYA